MNNVKVSVIVAISFADDKFKNAQRLNTKTAFKYGADKVIEYSPADIDKSFRDENKAIFDSARGYGYWLWKPYFIDKTLQEVSEGDYVVYVDAGAAYVNNIKLLIDVMDRDHQDVMCFCIDQVEKEWDKRDALILMDADEEKILNSNQICGGYIVVKKSPFSVGLIKQYLYYAQDERIITDEPNVMGYENYMEFKDHRHDQSIWSLLCKKNGVLPYRDPSQFGIRQGTYPIPREVLDRSTFPQIVESHRRGDIRFFFQLEYAKRVDYCIARFFYKVFGAIGKMIIVKGKRN